MAENTGILVSVGAGTAGGLFTLLGQWIRARYSKKPADATDYITRKEYEADRKEAENQHENLFGRMRSNEQDISATKALLEYIRNDIRDIKQLLMKGIK